MQKNQVRPGFTRLFQGKRHEMVQIAQVRGDKDGFRMRPAESIGIPQGEHLVCQERGTGKRAGMCLRALRKVVYITRFPRLPRRASF